MSVVLCMFIVVTHHIISSPIPDHKCLMHWLGHSMEDKKGQSRLQHLVLMRIWLLRLYLIRGRDLPIRGSAIWSFNALPLIWLHNKRPIAFVNQGSITCYWWESDSSSFNRFGAELYRQNPGWNEPINSTKPSMRTIAMKTCDAKLLPISCRMRWLPKQWTTCQSRIKVYA